MESLLPRDHLQDQLAVLRSALGEPGVTLALIELSSWLTGSRRPLDAALNPSDRTVAHELLQELHDLSDMLALRMFRPAFLCSDTSAIRHDRFVDPAFAESPTYSWKPRDALWTSPLVQADTSAWSLMSEQTGDTERHSHFLSLAHPPRDSTMLLKSLADADSLLISNGGLTTEAWRSLRRNGCGIVDFTWRCVLEAEISALLGERDPGAFPGGLGVECSLL